MKSKSILDFLHTDITEFFSKKYKEIGSEDTLAIMTIDYELLLEKKEFEIFDCLRLRVMFDKLNVESEQHINVHLSCRHKTSTRKKTNSFIYNLYNILGKDIQTTIISKNESLPDTFFTSWISPIGDSYIQVHRDENLNIELHILFANNILKEFNKKIDF